MAASEDPLRIGFVPEHFSTPLHFAQKHFFLSAQLIPFKSGTGHMITALRAGEIDVGIGLTEGWITGLGKWDIDSNGGYKLVGTYVETPLLWAISTGPRRDDINSIEDLKNLEDRKIGVSRIGSGSHVMGFVLADKQGLRSEASEPFKVIPLDTFDGLREGVNKGTVDFFMWEHFTSKRYFKKLNVEGIGEIKRIGEIYTPWSSWMIVAGTHLESGSVLRLDDLFEKLNKGIKYFLEHEHEAIEYISTEMDYSKEDAQEWLETVKFSSNVKGVDLKVIKGTVKTLKKAGVLGEVGMQAEQMIGEQFGAQVP